jgi:hypothetical protein
MVQIHYFAKAVHKRVVVWTGATISKSRSPMIGCGFPRIYLTGNLVHKTSAGLSTTPDTLTPPFDVILFPFFFPLLY